MLSASIAATRLTVDSSASDSSPTDPVSHHASVFRTIVPSAAAIDSQAYFSRGLEVAGKAPIIAVPGLQL